MATFAIVPEEAPDLRQLTQDWLADRLAAGCTPATMHGHTKAMSVLLQYAERHGIERVTEITPAFLNQMQADLLNRPRQDGKGEGKLSRFTVAAYLRPIRTFLRWCADPDEGMGLTVKGRVKMPRLPERHVEVLTRHELRLLESAAREPRDQLIVALFGQTGIRNSELCGLRVGDLLNDGRRTLLRVRGHSHGGGAKFDKERLVPLPTPTLARQLVQYISRYRPKEEDDHLFLSLRRDRRTGRYEPLTIFGVGQLIHKLGLEAGIGRRVHPHMLRHTFATINLAKGMTSTMVATLLGHTTTAMVDRTYGHVKPENENIYDALNRIWTADD